MTAKQPLWLAGVMLTSLVARGDAPKVDAKADELLKKMSAELQGMKSMQFDADHTMEMVTKEGEKLQYVAESRVQLQRPNKLRSDRTGPLADLAFFYDGNNVTIYGKKLNLYAQEKAPGNLDQMIDFARDSLDLDAPAADLLYGDVYQGLMQDVDSGQYLGLEEIGDRACHHLAFRKKETDFQIWIQDGPHALPCRYVIISKTEQGSPSYTVELNNWKENPAIPAMTFQFTAPKGAGKINFFKPTETNKVGSK